MLDARQFRQAMGCFATGIAVVTLLDAEGLPIGLTVNSLTSVSLDPPLVLFCVDKRAHMHPMLKKAKSFAFNFLGQEQEAVSRHFADRHHFGAPKNLWDKPQQGCPILRGTLGWILCEKANDYAGGDHTIMLGKVVGLRKRPGNRAPLLYFHGRYGKLKA